MWFKKKTELEKLIEGYGKDQDILLGFAKSVQKPRIEEITLEDVKGYYKAVLTQSTPYTALSHMKAIRMFFREHRSRKCLRASEIRDNPLYNVGKNVIIPPMPEKKKNPRGRPANLEMIKKIKFLIDEGGLSLRAVARAEGKSVKTIHTMYHYPKNYSNAKFVGKKFSPHGAIA